MAIITSLTQKDALPFFRKMVAESWSDAQAAPNFLRSLCTPKSTTAKAVSIEVQRRTRKVAAEVIRGGSPNMHRGDKSTEKMFIPPYFSDAILLNDLDVYTRVFGDGVGTVSRSDIREMARSTVEGLLEMKSEQERYIETQISNVLNNGVVNTLEGQVNYHRKAESMITNTGGDLWSDTSADALAQFKADAEFIATQGNSGSGRFNVILGSEAQVALFDNDKLLAQADLRYVKLVDIGMPNIQMNGAVLHGVVSSGPYQFFLWSYPQYFDLGTKTGDLKDTNSYIDPKSYYMLSEDVELRLWKAGLPTVFKKEERILGARPVFNDGWSVHEAVSQEKQTHKAIVRVAPLMVPYSVDRMVTRKVLA